MRGLWAITLLLLLGACGRQIDIKEDCSCGFYTTADGKMMHWNDGAKINMKMSSAVPVSMRAAVAAAASTYNSIFENTQMSVDMQNFTAPDFHGDPKSVSGDGVNGIYWVTGEWPWKGDKSHSDAMTVVFFNDEGVAEADVYFRASSFDMSSSQPSMAIATESAHPVNYSVFSDLRATSASVWINLLAIHEFGHVLGRVHTDDETSIMYPSVGRAHVYSPMGESDFEKFSQAYKLRSGI